MHLFNVNHQSHGFMDEDGRCHQCAIRERRDDLPAISNQINLDTLTEVSWEDGMWIVHFGEIYYRVHDDENMDRLEAALSLTRPDA